jgi:hypothetical protein
MGSVWIVAVAVGTGTFIGLTAICIGTGAVTGAILGSVVPVAGTAVGAGIGTAIGTGVGVLFGAYVPVLGAVKLHQQRSTKFLESIKE